MHNHFVCCVVDDLFDFIYKSIGKDVTTLLVWSKILLKDGGTVCISIDSSSEKLVILLTLYA